MEFSLGKQLLVIILLIFGNGIFSLLEMAIVSCHQSRLEALAVSSRLSPLKPLGSYRLDIQGGDSPRLQLSTLSGDLQLSGLGQWVDSRLHFNGEASASPEREAALSNLLNILGRRQGARSIITFALLTLPCCANSCCKSLSRIEYGRLPTYSLLPMNGLSPEN